MKIIIIFIFFPEILKLNYLMLSNIEFLLFNNLLFLVIN